jgi:hypothetical protein
LLKGGVTKNGAAVVGGAPFLKQGRKGPMSERKTLRERKTPRERKTLHDENNHIWTV